MPTLRIAPRFLEEPFRIVGDGRTDEAVGIDELGLSDELADRIEAWIDAFDAVHDADQPSRPGFPDREAQERWQAEGRIIADRLAAELDADWTVELVMAGADERRLA